ncbi:MAG: efflux RND transporter permease subunit [Gammaproteobacteria bacterium]|nr:efflux RND transporter permease subunit [Gammaproteobacteria bacterium]
MLSRLIQFALTQRLLMLLAVVLIGGAGWKAVRELPIDAFPDVSPTQVKIIIKAPGMTPEEVEARITAPIEVEMLGIPRQTMLRSTAKYALCDLTVDFEEGTDIYWARQQVAERLNGIRDMLPQDISGGIAPLTTPLGEMFMFTVENDALSLTEKRTLLDWVIRPALRAVPGVADVNALGGLVRTFEITPHPARMAARGIDVGQLAAAVQAGNRNDGAGRLSDGEETLLVRSVGAIRTLDDLGDIVVAAHPAEPVRVRDVASVGIGSLTRYGAVTRDGTGEAVEGLVLGLRGANARQVVEGVRARLAELAPTLPAGTTVPVFYDRGDLVARAVGTVAEALAEAIVLVLILLVLFLGDLRAAFTVALILPLAALTTFILMRHTGMSANLMSLGGLAIAIGMLVDAAVVVVENVVAHLAEEGGQRRVPRLHVIFRATQEVAVPVTSGILIIIIVFLPLLTLQGLEGKLFTPVATTITFALGSSLLLSLTVIPVLASYLIGTPKHGNSWLVRQAHRVYGPALEWSLRHARLVIAAALLLLGAAAFAFTRLGSTFMPTMDEGNIIVQIEKLPSISLQESTRMDTLVQRAILDAVPEVAGIVARTGSDEIGLDPMGLNQTDAFLVLKPRDQWRMRDKQALIAALRTVLDRFPGISYGFTQPIEMRVSEMLTGVRGDVAMKIFGPDLDTLNRLVDQTAALVEGIAGAEDVFATRNQGVQYLQLDFDRLAIGRVGLSVDAVARVLRAMVEGDDLGIVYENDRRTPLIVRGDADLRASAPQLANLKLTLDDGRQVPLASLARLQRVEGPVAIARERGARMGVVLANVAGRDLVGFVAEARREVAAKIELPTGYRVEWGGQFENQQRAATRLALVVPVALGLIFLLLFSTFGSVRQALLVLTNVPLALVGGVFGLLLAGEYLSVPASVGFIALLGIAVLNGIVMLTHFNSLRALGTSMDVVVVEGAKRRLRPVLMTASIAAFGLVPLLTVTGPGSEIQRPLAIVVIGGLVSATALTLIVLPILYRRFGAPR